MKKILAIAAGCMIAIAGSQALAASPYHVHVTKTLVVAMHDPGCHWFSRHGKLTTHATVFGTVRVVNQDEAALRVMSPHGMQHVRHIPVGRSLVLRRGHYMLMMVGQAFDDNHLMLTVR